MPRYPLIISDETYTKLIVIARAKNLSMGKLINTILEEYANLKSEELLKHGEEGSRTSENSG
jgi:predicted DNA-binding ribbon-helix-helix protein